MEITQIHLLREGDTVVVYGKKKLFFCTLGIAVMYTVYVIWK